ncbi:MAG: hypothetical protein CMH62_03260, partial [Nanoarchaeota archaeon]|nr:hypothetical protein [Nanoarchaeota archaeon]
RLFERDRIIFGLSTAGHYSEKSTLFKKTLSELYQVLPDIHISLGFTLYLNNSVALTRRSLEDIISLGFKNIVINTVIDSSNRLETLNELENNILRPLGFGSPVRSCSHTHPIGSSFSREEWGIPIKGHYFNLQSLEQVVFSDWWGAEVTINLGLLKPVGRGANLLMAKESPLMPDSLLDKPRHGLSRQAGIDLYITSKSVIHPSVHEKTLWDVNIVNGDFRNSFKACLENDKEIIEWLRNNYEWLSRPV